MLVLQQYLLLKITRSGDVIDNKNTNTVSQNTQTNNSNVEDDGLGITADDTYKGNPIEIKRKSSSEGEKSEYGMSKITVNYVQISGLKDKSIESKINNEIAATVSNLKDEYKDKVNMLNINALCTANFENVLSVRIDLFAELENEEYISKYYGLNYNLANGDEISFKDVFTSNAAIKSILSKSAYDSLIVKTVGGDSVTLYDDPLLEGDEDYNANIDFDPVSPKKFSNVEDEVFKIMSYYSSGKEIQFSFSPSNVYAYINDTAIKIPMKHYLNQIAIYNRYKSNEDIYDGSYSDYIENNAIPVLLPINNSGVQLNYDTYDGTSGISYVNAKKYDDNFIWIQASASYDDEIGDMVFDEEKIAKSVSKINEVIKDFNSREHNSFISIAIFQEPYFHNSQSEGDFYISVSETANDDIKDIATKMIRYYQGLYNFDDSYYGDEHGEIYYEYVYYKDTNSWKRFDENTVPEPSTTTIDNNTDNNVSQTQTNDLGNQTVSNQEEDSTTANETIENDGEADNPEETNEVNSSTMDNTIIE